MLELKTRVVTHICTGCGRGDCDCGRRVLPCRRCSVCQEIDRELGAQRDRAVKLLEIAFTIGYTLARDGSSSRC